MAHSSELLALPSRRLPPAYPALAFDAANAQIRSGQGFLHRSQLMPPSSVSGLADVTRASQVTRLKAGILRNSGQHPRSNLLAIMKSKDKVGVTIMSKGPMGS